MTVLWPGFFFALGLIPVLIAAYIWILRRRRPFAVRYSSLSLLREALPRQSWLRRRLPFVLFLAALSTLILAASRPVSVISVPSNQTTILLVMDVSMSMRSADIPPSRLEAAEAAALSFIQKQKSSTQIGIVAFSGYAEEILAPTTDQNALESAVESLTVGRSTAIGSGIFRAIDSIADIDKLVAPISDEAVAPVPHGAYAPDIIVLLTDGVSNAGPPPLEAAQAAVDRGVRVYTIGYGTENGTIDLNARGSDPFGGGGAGGPFGGGGGGGRSRFRTPIDEDMLKEIASMTGGAYYAATSASELQAVFQKLPTYLITKHETTEISVFFAALGAALAIAAILLSLSWQPLP